MFCRLKDFRRVATRYDRNAINFLTTVCMRCKYRAGEGKIVFERA